MSQNIGRTGLAFSRSWHQISCSSPASPPMGRLSSHIAQILMGKHKPMYDPSTDCGDYVVVTDCVDILATGKKMQKTLYYNSTTRPGSLRSISMERLMQKWGGGELLKRAVRGMLPKNRLRDKRLARLKVFEGSDHPFKKNLVRVNDRVRDNAGGGFGILPAATREKASTVSTPTQPISF